MSFKKVLMGLMVCILSVSFLSCATSTPGEDVVNDEQVTAELNAEMANIMEAYSKAMTSDDPAIVDEFKAALKAFDVKYDSDLSTEFEVEISKSTTRLSGGTTTPITDLPINKDGAVYLSGGKTGLVSTVIDWVSPSVTPGHYYHGAVLDMDKYDPNNLDGQCFQTAITKGAGYETPNEWMRKGNVSVLNPKTTPNASSLNSAQNSMDYYCKDSNKNMKYGFFKNYVNIFNLTTKSDNYYWYCTKVCWRIYNQIGINLDSDDTRVDWTTSGLYKIVKAYYYARYWYSWSKARSKISEYMNNARKVIVLAEEIYYSPYLTKVFEKIRE